MNDQQREDLFYPKNHKILPVGLRLFTLSYTAKTAEFGDLIDIFIV